jgi:uncharacterized membrane protein YdbT with pleckstrin-like domain
MKCVSCGSPIPEGGQFCPKCGGRQSPTGIPAPPPSAPEPEAAVWAGRYSPFADGLSWLLWGIYAAVAVYAALNWLPLTERWQKYVYWGAVLLPAVLIGFASLVRRISVRYRLTTHRLFKEVGIVSRKISEIELMRVDDLTVTQNIIQRMFDVGVVTLVTSDASDPRLEIAGIRHPVEVKEHIRTQVQKRRGRTLNVESL